MVVLTGSECTVNETIVEAVDSKTCAVQCAEDISCVALSMSTSEGVCMVHRQMFLEGVCYAGDWDHYNVKNRCMNLGNYDEDKRTCQCYGGYIGQYCERIMQDCSEGYTTHHYNSGSGIYMIHPVLSPTPFQVWCRMNHGGNTFVQRRKDGSTNFNRSWQEYKEGFGDLSKDFWLGNEQISYITNGRSHQFVFLIKDEGSNKTRHRVYRYFTLSQDGMYTMRYQYTFGHNDPLAHGGDCLGELKGQPFSTYDQDPDDSPLNCAQEHQSGFWFKNCTPCNPNGVWSDTHAMKRARVPEEMFWTGDNLILSFFAVLTAL
ncbi:fibrinogen-like protein 1 [Haliotis rubra]|uniref:fibrinogen-like protein 1 n=1 Tax=Haliotis rubra TaxID=36100 RepID=UPI001EE60DEF|nr:fibrinogen-like protein 1 [Haliotis rubra]